MTIRIGFRLAMDPAMTWHIGSSLLMVLAASSYGCGDSDSDTGVDGGSGAGTSCSEESVTDSYPDATGAGACTTASGLAIANSMMNLEGLTIDNNGTEMTPCVTVTCDDDYAYIVTNDLPHYDFVQTTPNELAEDVQVFRIPLAPQAPAGVAVVDIDTLTGCEDAYENYVAGTTPNTDPANFCADAETGYLQETSANGVELYAQIPCLGSFGLLINGVNANGPNEAGFPDPFGDPALSYPDTASEQGAAALDFCGGHTGGNMHYHGAYDPCFQTDDDGKPELAYADAVLSWSQLGLVSDLCTEESGIVGWSVDGYPIKGPCVCVSRDESGTCTTVKRARSSWQHKGLGSHVATPDASLDLEGTSCTSDDDCCPGDDCDYGCNYALTAGSEAGTAVEKICGLKDYSWCTSVYADQTSSDVSGQDFVYVDRCNGFDGADGFAYHATGTFPYIQGCYRGEPADQALPEGGGGPPGGGPPGGM